MSSRKEGRRFYAVVRLAAGEDTGPSHGSFDGRFKIDNQLPHDLIALKRAALRLMQRLPLSVNEVQITRGDTTRPVYFVAHWERFSELVAAFNDWFRQPFPLTHDATYFVQKFTGSDVADSPEHIIAWWSLADNLAWTLDPQVAERLLEAFTPSPD
ncbi:hypothetical protein KY386_02510 [Candidatus Parcubacteria bacterium]|nr:hypothetical protein [Candidatus Parcubacteria bacterium]